MAPEPGPAWLTCHVAIDKHEADASGSERARRTDAASTVWIRESSERHFLDLDDKDSAWSCSDFPAQASVQCEACHWFDTREEVCLGGGCGRTAVDVSAQECLDGTFADAADASAWLKRDHLVNRHWYAAACIPPADFTIPSVGSKAVAVVDGEVLQASHAIGAAFEEALLLLAGRPGILGPLLGCLCCAFARGCHRTSWPRQRCRSWWGDKGTPRDECDQSACGHGTSTERTFGGASSRPPLRFPKGDTTSRETSREGSKQSTRAGSNTRTAPEPDADALNGSRRNRRDRCASNDSASSDISASQGAPEVIQRIHDELLDNITAPELERKKLLRRHQIQWHPDKNAAERRDLATAVTQFLNSKKAWFLGRSPSMESASLLP